MNTRPSPAKPPAGIPPLNRMEQPFMGDGRTLTLLQHKISGPIQVTESYAGGRVPMPTAMNGYQFSWGQIAERLAGLMLVWDFYLPQVQAEYSRRGSITAMQETMIAQLEAATNVTLRDNAVTWERLSADGDGWKVLPGTIGKSVAFSVLCHLGAEQAARNWLIAEFIPEILPQIQRGVLDALEE